MINTRINLTNIKKKESYEDDKDTDISLDSLDSSDHASMDVRSSYGNNRKDDSTDSKSLDSLDI